MAIFKFPEDSFGESKEYPFISFRTRSSKAPSSNTNHVITLPVPQGVTFSDGLGYGNLDLGIIGAPIANGNQNGRSVSELAADQTQKLQNSTNRSGNEAAFIAGKFASNLGLSTDKFTNLYGASSNIAINPNTVLQFESPEIRTFSFQFRLVAESRAESERIRKMISVIRESIYPDVTDDSILYKYPDVWKFDFGGGAERYLPRSHNRCFCTNFATTYNSNTNAFHEDGAPADVTIQLTLRESKALSRKEVSNYS